MVPSEAADHEGSTLTQLERREYFRVRPTSIAPLCTSHGLWLEYTQRGQISTTRLRISEVWCDPQNNFISTSGVCELTDFDCYNQAGGYVKKTSAASSLTTTAISSLVALAALVIALSP